MPTIFTIGHSTRSIEELIDLLNENRVKLLADVRTMPHSRTNPQFNKEAMPGPLENKGIEYLHIPGLGGLRSKQNLESVNKGWKNSSFRNYADYALTQDFEAALDDLKERAAKTPTAYMCSEAVWWKCHRRIITDYLLAQGWEVKHIMAKGKGDLATMTPIAIAENPNRIIYPAEQQELLL